MEQVLGELLGIGPLSITDECERYPERAIGEHAQGLDLPPFYLRLLLLFSASREFYLSVAKDDLWAREAAKQILLDQTVIFIRAMLENGFMESEPRETGAFIHTLALEFPKAIVVIHQQPPYEYELVRLMVEYVPSMQLLVDQLEDNNRFNLLVLACLACKYPSAKTFELAKRLFARHIERATELDAHLFQVLRLLIRAFPPLVETLSSSPCMELSSEYENALLSGDIKEITENLNKPIYRTEFSCLL